MLITSQIREALIDKSARGRQLSDTKSKSKFYDEKFGFYTHFLIFCQPLSLNLNESKKS
jgi:hypothetical protein